MKSRMHECNFPDCFHHSGLSLLKRLSFQLPCLYFHGCGNISGEVRERNVSDDYAGAAMGASILREKSDKGGS